MITILLLFVLRNTKVTLRRPPNSHIVHRSKVCWDSRHGSRHESHWPATWRHAPGEFEVVLLTTVPVMGRRGENRGGEVRIWRGRKGRSYCIVQTSIFLLFVLRSKTLKTTKGLRIVHRSDDHKRTESFTDQTTTKELNCSSIRHSQKNCESFANKTTTKELNHSPIRLNRSPIRLS